MLIRQKLALMAPLLLVMVGCKTLLSTDVYLSDLFLDENVRTPALMRLEIPSCSGDSRADYSASVLALFDSSAEAKLVGCETQGMDSLLEVAFLAEMATDSSSADLILFRHIIEEESRYIRGVKPVLGQSFLTRVEQLMSDNLQTFDPEELTFSLSLHHDEKDPVKVSAPWAWVDGEPHENFRQEVFERRQKIALRLSNVASQLVVDGDQPVVLWVAKTKP